MGILGVRCHTVVVLFAVIILGVGYSAKAYDSGVSYTGVKLGLVSSGSVDTDDGSDKQQTGLSAGFF
jgi:hypothetical protein